MKEQDPRYPNQFPQRFVWRDLTRDDEELKSSSKEHPVEVRALPIRYSAEMPLGVDVSLTSADRSSLSSVSSSPYFNESDAEGDYLEFFAGTFVDVRSGGATPQTAGHIDHDKPLPLSSPKEKDGSDLSTDRNFSGASATRGHTRREADDLNVRSKLTAHSARTGSAAKEKSLQPRMKEAGVGREQQRKPEGLFGKWGRSGVKLFKAGAKAAMSLASEVSANQQGYPTVAQKRNLETVAEMLYARPGTDILKAIWKLLFPSEPFVPKGPQWQVIGFKNDDPQLDDNVARAGILGLQSFREFVEAYHVEARAAVNDGVPIAKISLDVTLSLAVFFGLNDSSFSSKKQAFWQLFNVSPLVFCSLSCFATRLALHNFSEGKPYRDAVATAVRLMEHVLSEGPTDLHEVKHIASALGVSCL